MTRLKPLWMGAAAGDAPVNYTMREMRGIISAIIVGEGVCKSTDFLISPRAGGANRSVDMNGGWAVIQGETQAGQNKYLAPADAVENLTAPAAPGSGTRYHVVYLQIRDRKEDGGGNYDWIPNVLANASVTAITNTAQADAALAAATIKSAIPLAVLTDTPTTTSFTTANIKDVRPFAVAINGAGSTTDEAKGVTTATTDGSGWMTVTHNLGRKPVGGLVSINKPSSGSGPSLPTTAMMAIDGTETPTTVRVRAFIATAFYVYVNRSLTVSWRVW